MASPGDNRVMMVHVPAMLHAQVEPAERAVPEVRAEPEVQVPPDVLAALVEPAIQGARQVQH